MAFYIILFLVGELFILLLFSAYQTHNRKYSIDNMTGLPNKEAFLQSTESLYRESKKIFILALDNFKIINETYGIKVGDMALIDVAHELKKQFPGDDIYRYEGDVFALVVANKKNVYYIEKLKQVLDKERKFNNVFVQLQACICQLETFRYDSDGVMQMVEFMISEVKKQGPGSYLEANDDVKKGFRRKSMVEQTLMEHIRDEFFEVHYQPIWDVKARKFHSMEALVRMKVPEFGYVSPEEFILVAEKNGMVLKLGMIVLEEVCKFISSCDVGRYGIELVEINLSVIQCVQPGLSSEVLAILDKYSIPPEMINLEITESAQAYSEKMMSRNIARLALKNVSFSLDDYGSGYSNINYLTDFPFDIVKVDKGLVWEAMKKVSSRYILENTIEMCKRISKRVVTEGIEDEEMLRMVENMGADYVQGYHFSKPLPKEKLIEFLEVNPFDKE